MVIANPIPKTARPAPTHNGTSGRPRVGEVDIKILAMARKIKPIKIEPRLDINSVHLETTKAERIKVPAQILKNSPTTLLDSES